MPVAKVSEGVLAEAWHVPNAVIYGERAPEVSSSSSPDAGSSTSSSTTSSAPEPLSRWRPGRVLVRHARRLAAAATAHRDSPLEVEAWAQYCEQEEALSAIDEQDAPALPDNIITVDAHPPEPRPSMR